MNARPDVGAYVIFFTVLVAFILAVAPHVSPPVPGSMDRFKITLFVVLIGVTYVAYQARIWRVFIPAIVVLFFIARANTEGG